MGEQPTDPQESIAEDREVLSALEHTKVYLECTREDRRIPGLSVAVVCDGATLWSGGFGRADVASGRPADADTLYPLASITKVVTTMALVRLRDEGKLGLDDPISQWIPELGIQNPFPDAAPPTIRQAVSHTAGFPRETVFDCWETLEFPSIEELLPSLPQMSLIVPPLTEEKYSNLAFALLGLIVARASGEPYEVWVGEQVLGPLGMVSSSFTPAGSLADRVTTLYPWADDDGAGPPCPEMKLGCFSPVGGLYSSVADMARFISLHLGRPPAGAEGVLRRSSIREMQVVQWVSDDGQSGRGLGWALGRTQGARWIGHGGGLPGLSTDLLLLPELGIGVAVFTNGRGMAGEVSREAVGILAPAVARARKRRKPAEPKEAPAEWHRYCGRYRAPVGSTQIEVMVLDGKMVVRTVGDSLDDLLRLAPKSEHVFTMENGGSKGEDAVFTVDEAGRVTKLRLGGYAYLSDH